MSPVSAELCALNAALERNELTELPVTLWQQWIWGSDPHEPAELLNACHLRGLLVARFRGRFRAEELFGAVGDALPNLVHAATKPRELGLVQLRDQLDDLQLNWAAHVHPHLDRCHELLDALNARFGQLADEGMHEPSDLVDPQTNTISVNALRHFLAIFVILYRHLWLWAHCSESALEAAPGAPVINKYHVEAGLELFNELAMVATVPPAARLLYKQDFRGMYHNMSQVVYFHFPDYNAPLQLELEALQRGQSYHALAPLHEVAPDVPIRMEDDDLSAESKCFVLLAGGYVFLWRGPDDIVFCRNVFAVIS